MKKIFNKTLGIGIIGLTILLTNGLIVDSTNNSNVYSINLVETNYEFVEIYKKNDTFIALDSNGDLWAWGNNDNGQIGNGNKGIDQDIPIKISDSMPSIVNVYGNETSNIALDSNGDLWTWGNNDNGQIGNGQGGNIGDFQDTPVQITGLNSVVNPLITVGFESVYGNQSAFIALDSNGDLWGWGENNYGQVGNGNKVDQTTPIQITGSESTNPLITVDFVEVYGESNIFIALDSNEDLWGWGRNSDGQVGSGNKIDQTTPIKISNSMPSIKNVFQNEITSFALDTNGDLWGWGNNAFGQVGNGEPLGKDQITPTKISNSMPSIENVYGDGYTNFALDTNEDLWGWGNNNYGQVGDGTKSNQITPIKISNSMPSIENVYGNGTTNFALDSNGDLRNQSNNSD